jgi:flagellar basal body-associated protein FliL
MADEAAVAEKKEAAAGEAAPAAGKGGSLGPLLGLVAVLLVAVGAAWFIAGSLAAEPVKPLDEDGAATAGGEAKPQGPVWDDESPIDLGDILANVNKEGGRRYVKATVQIWVKTTDAEVAGRPDILPSLVAAVQDRLRGYTMEDFQRENQKETMNHDITTIVDKTLRDLTRSPDRERSFVTRVVFNYLVQ